MSEINDFELTREANSIAGEILSEMLEDGAHALLERCCDRAHEVADGHQWVIYHFKALMLCAYCDTHQGEDLAEEMGFPPEKYVDIGSHASMVAYGELKSRIESRLYKIVGS